MLATTLCNVNSITKPNDANKACFPMYEKVSNSCSSFPPPQESVKLPPSGDCPPTREWVLVDVVKSSHLGPRKRLPKLEKMKQTKIGLGMTTT